MNQVPQNIVLIRLCSDLEFIRYRHCYNSTSTILRRKLRDCTFLGSNYISNFQPYPSSRISTLLFNNPLPNQIHWAHLVVSASLVKKVCFVIEPVHPKECIFSPSDYHQCTEEFASPLVIYFISTGIQFLNSNRYLNYHVQW